MSVTFRTGLAAATLSLGALASPAGAQCDRIAPVAAAIEIFESSTAPAPLRAVVRADLPDQICRLERKNSRYRIRLGSEEVWVSSAQFSGPPVRYARPAKIRPEKTPAGVRLSQRRGDRAILKTVSRKSITVRAKRRMMD